MGRIIVTEFVSLDGVMEAPGGGEDFEHGGWTFEIDRGAEGDKFKLDEALDAEALLLGRLTYEGFAAAWPSVEGEFADKFNTMPKYVVSSTLKEAEWNNSTVLKGDVVEEVSKLRQTLHGDIVVHGSARLVQTLVEHDLVDELRADGLPCRPRDRQTPLRPHERQEGSAPRRLEGGRRRCRHPHVRAHERGSQRVGNQLGRAFRNGALGRADTPRSRKASSPPTDCNAYPSLCNGDVAVMLVTYRTNDEGTEVGRKQLPQDVRWGLKAPRLGRPTPRLI